MAVDFKVAHNRTSEYRIAPERIDVRAELNGRHELPDIEWLIADILKNGQHTCCNLERWGNARPRRRLLALACCQRNQQTEAYPEAFEVALHLRQVQ